MNTNKIFAFGIAVAIAATSGTALAAANGEKLFKKKCGACHSLEAGKQKIGPSLAGIVGRQAGTVEGYTKYKAMKGATLTWDAAMLDAWITNQKDFLKANKAVVGGPRTAMNAKIKKPAERAAIIAYLSESHD